MTAATWHVTTTLQEALVLVALWGLAGAGVALVWLALPWPKSSRALKPLGCAVCMAGWGTGLVALARSHEGGVGGLALATLAALALPRGALMWRALLVAGGGTFLLAGVIIAARRHGAGLAEAACLWAAAWAVAAAVVSIAWREPAAPADLDRDLPR